MRDYLTERAARNDPRLPCRATGVAPHRFVSEQPVRPLRELARYNLVAADARVGTIADAYFDVFTWTVRYLCLDTSDRPGGRYVMISPIAAGEIDTDNGLISIELTRDQIESSPSFDGRPVVTRHFEEEYYGYYDWPPYWDTIATNTDGRRIGQDDRRGAAGAATADTGLRSCNAIRESVIGVKDAAAASLEDFIVDTRYWVIRYLQVRHIDAGVARRRLVSPGWIERLCWAPPAVRIDLPPAAFSECR